MQDLPMTTFAGKWQTTFGPMELTQENARVHGTYHYLSTACTLEGKIVRGRLVFRYVEPSIRGEGWFELTRRGKAFLGQFRPEGAEHWEPWEGEQVGFNGLWNSSFGLLRLIESGDDQVHGFYEEGGGATLAGRRKGNRLIFSYREPQARGRGRFELADDGLSFQGEWKARGDVDWRPWSGIRMRPQNDQTWLVVFEAPWQQFLADKEYSFGNMLREFFARAPHVQVWHRFFTNEAGLRKCCRDLLYMAEPVVLVLATHARPEGITVDGQTIGIATLIDSLRHVGNLRLLHFSACSLMQDPAVVDLMRAFGDEVRVPISGYRTRVDWAASAIIEFTFLEMVLARGLTPADAAERLTKLLPFAGDKGEPGAVFPPAGFTIVMPSVTPGRKRTPRR